MAGFTTTFNISLWILIVSAFILMNCKALQTMQGARNRQHLATHPSWSTKLSGLSARRRRFLAFPARLQEIKLSEEQFLTIASCRCFFQYFVASSLQHFLHCRARNVRNARWKKFGPSSHALYELKRREVVSCALYFWQVKIDVKKHFLAVGSSSWLLSPEKFVSFLLWNKNIYFLSR